MEEENAEEKIRQAVLAIRKSRTSPAGRHWLDVAEGFLAQALTLSSPHPEAREEDIATISDALNLMKGYTDDADEIANSALAALSRLAAPKPEGPSNNPETPDGSPRDCDTCRHWGGWSKNCGFCHNRSKWEGRSAPEPRPAEEPAPVVSHDAADTIHNAGSVSHDNREPDGRKGE